MIHEIVRNTLIFGIVVLLSFFIDYKKSVKYWYVLLFFFIIGFIDNMLGTITIEYPNTELIKTHNWNNALNCNWSPKIYSIVFAMLLLNT